MKPIDEKKYPTYRSAYGFLCLALIFFPIVYLVGAILVQSFLKYDTASGYSLPAVLGMQYGSSLFGAMLFSKTENAKAVSSACGAISMVLSLALILLLSYAQKGKKGFFYAASILTLVDALFVIPDICLRNTFLLKATTADLIVLSILHLLGLVVAVMGVYVAKRLEITEKNEVTQ